MPPPSGDRSPHDAMSDDDVSVTSSVVSEMQDEYFLDKILAEKKTSDGLRWLVRWEGYPEERSTWEPRSSFTSGEAFDDWQAQKMRIARGYDKPFDVAALEKRVDALEKAQAIRRVKRRAKRIRLQLPVSPESDELDSSDGAKESDEEIPLDRPLVSRRGSLRTADKILDDSIIEDDEIGRDETSTTPKISTHAQSPRSEPDTGDQLSDDSLVEGLRMKEFNKTHNRLQKKLQPREESATVGSPETTRRNIPQVGTAQMQSPPTRQRSFVRAEREQSPPSRQIPPVGADRRQSQPSKILPLVGIDRRKSLPTLSPPKYSATVNRATSQRKGAVGTGPKRYTKKQPRYHGKPKVQGAAIMGRWDATVKPRKRTTVVPGLVPSPNAKTFGKLSIKWKYEKAGRNEPAPNPDNLVFINPGKDKVVPQAIFSPKRNKSPAKTVWEIYQERRKKDRSDAGDVVGSSAQQPDVDEVAPMEIDSGARLDIRPAAQQPGSATEPEQSVEERESIKPTHPSRRQSREVSLATHASDDRADSLLEGTPNSAIESPRKTSGSFQSEYADGVLEHNRHAKRHANEEDFPRPGLDPKFRVLTGPKKSIHEPVSDLDGRAILATIRTGHEGHEVGGVRLKGLALHHKVMLLRTKTEGQLEFWFGVCCTAVDYKRYLLEVSNTRGCRSVATSQSSAVLPSQCLFTNEEVGRFEHLRHGHC